MLLVLHKEDSVVVATHSCALSLEPSHGRPVCIPRHLHSLVWLMHYIECILQVGGVKSASVRIGNDDLYHAGR